MPDSVGVLYATTSAPETHLQWTHEKCPLFTTNEARKVIACVYRRAKEGRGMCSTSVTAEAAKIMEKAASLSIGAIEEEDYNGTHT